MTAKDLKNALLQEAVQGKLVPQIASEGNAKDLLEEIKKEKAKLIKEGKIKKEKPLPEITEDEIPFDIPENWCWCRLGELITFVGGYAYDSHSFIDKSDYQVLRLGNVKNGYLQLSAKPVFINLELAEKTKAFKCITNDILVTMTGTRLKRDYFFTTLVTENDKNLYVNQRVGCLRPTQLIFANFLNWILKSKPILDYIFEFETGTANQGNIGSENIKTIPIPLPPFTEQKRIVAAIEKFMPLIEEYGKKETELKAFNEQIGALTKKAILQEAVQGKLVPQIAVEGNAKDLLDEIRKERLSHGLDFANAKSGKRKSKKETALAGSNPCDISDDEIPFDIPENWCWCRLGEVTEIARGGSPRPIKDYLTTDESGYNWIKIGDTDKNGKYINQTSEKIVKEGLDKTRLVHKGDFLLTNSMSFGRPYILNIDGCIHDGWLVISPKGNIFNKDFLYYVLSSTFAYNQFCDSVSGAVVKNLNSDKVRESLFPLPPLGEQKRIVAAIEKMLPLCEKLGT